MSHLPEGRKTLVYSTVDDHDIHLDYYLPRNLSGGLPVIVYYHGGGMTAGSRRDTTFPDWMYDHCQEKGYILVSADYRLCHPCSGLDQIEDAKALFKFLASSEFDKELPESVSVDTSRIAVSGSSAGAYSARAACVYAEPKPVALFTIFGLGGDVLLDHWTTGRPPTPLARLVNLEQIPEILANKTIVSDDTPTTGFMTNRFALTVRWELDGTFLDGCFAKPGLGAQLNKLEYSDRAAAVPDDVRAGFLQLFVGEQYPPSVFVHGTADVVVPAEESVNQHEQLKKLGIKTELLLVEGGAHGLMDFSNGFPPKPVKGAMEAYNKALEFIGQVFSKDS